MSNLVNKAKSSKLKESIQQNSNTKERVVRELKHKEHPRSYRFDPEIMNTLKDTLDRVNEISPKKVSEAKLVKALVLLSKDIDEKKLLKAIKEVW